MNSGYLPQELVVDHGPDFDSVYFEALLAQCFITKVERPVAEPHAGAVIERLFGKTQVDFIQQLRGNTQATKVPRLLTREVDPKRLAVWTLERFTVHLRQYAYEYYDQMEHSALFLSPREAYAQGMQLAGARSHRVIPYTDAFVMQTRPTTRTGAAKIHRSRGITVNGLQYWNERMHASDIAGHSVPVRFEPYDMGVIYASIKPSEPQAPIHSAYEEENRDISIKKWRNVFGNELRLDTLTRKILNDPFTASVPWADEQFIDQHPYEFPIDINLRFRTRIITRVTGLATDEETRPNGFRQFELSKHGNLVPKNRSLQFTITMNVPEPYTIYWKVRNNGAEAIRARELRGEICKDEGSSERTETTLYAGRHYVECYIVKRGTVVARDRQNVIVIQNR